MTENQTTFSFAHDQPLADALNKISTKSQPRPSYAAFIQEIGTMLITARPGSVILAAVPSVAAVDQVGESLAEYLKQAKAHNRSNADVSLTVVDIPVATNIRQQRRAIADVYLGLPLASVGHKHNPQYDLAYGSSFVRPESLHQICNLIRVRSSQYYLVRGAHRLRPAGGSKFDAVNQLRFLFQVADQAKRTHVIFANTLTVAEWLEHGEISQEVQICSLRPCNNRNKESELEFKGLLKGYDKLIARDPGFGLLKSQTAIYTTVWGCPYRLNKWIRAAITVTLAQGGHTLTWEAMLQTKPTAAETKDAINEFKHHWSEDPTAEDSPAVSTPQLPPGQRSLGRDPTRQDVA